VLLRDELRARGRPSRLETAWVRPGWPLPYAVLCALGVGGALVTTTDARVGLAILLVVFASLAGDVSGIAPVVRRLTPHRATQCVVSEPLPTTRADVRVRLIVTAALDAPRTGFAYRLAPLEARARRLLRGHLSSPPAILCAALALLAALAGASALGLGGNGWIGPLAMVPAIALLLGAAAYLDIALSAAAPGNATAASAAAAVALVAALDADPPRHVAVELVLAGASAGGQLGMTAYVRRRRRAARPRELAVLALGPCATGPLPFHRTEGLLFPARMHPGLVALAGQIGLTGVRRGLTGAIATRRAGWPSLGIGHPSGIDRSRATPTSAPGPRGIEPEAIGETVVHCIELVRALDRQI
jgi:hypothetical protein